MRTRTVPVLVDVCAGGDGECVPRRQIGAMLTQGSSTLHILETFMSRAR